MPNTTVQATAEGMPTENTLEAMIDRYLSAKAAMDAGKAPQGSHNEAEFHTALEALHETDAKPSSYDGVMKALRFAAEEVHDTPDMVPNLLACILAPLEEREQELPSDRVDRLARELAETLARWANGSFMAMVYPEGDTRGYWFRNISVYDRKGQPDPITDAIQAYRDGEKAFCAIKEKDWPSHGGHEAVIDKTYRPPMHVLDNWNQAAVTKLGAMAALRFALEESEDFWCEPSVKAMMRAALGYLEGVAA